MEDCPATNLRERTLSRNLVLPLELPQKMPPSKLGRVIQITDTVCVRLHTSICRLLQIAAKGSVKLLEGCTRAIFKTLQKCSFEIAFCDVFWKQPEINGESR